MLRNVLRRLSGAEDPSTGSERNPLIVQGDQPKANEASLTDLSWRGRLAWMGIGTASFHLAYVAPPCAFLIGVYVFALFQLSRQRTRFQTMNTAWLLTFLVYAPHLAFFWRIFGPAAIALWLVLGFWLGLFLCLARFVRARWGETVAAIAAPFLWMGLEYFRSELYILRFSWLNVGYAFAWAKSLPLFAGLGVYGIGFALMATAAGLSRLRKGRAGVWGAGALALLALLTSFPSNSSPRPDQRTSGKELRIAGIQLEFPQGPEVVGWLERLRVQHPEADLYMLSEYTFQERPPEEVRQWCRRHGRYLLVGGKEPVNENDEVFFNMAYVIGPTGEIVFQQAKAQPIQFFKDGLPAPQQKVWDSPWGRVGICICYDLSYTHLLDRLARQGAQALLVPTMDVEEWGLYQHRLHARVAPMRAAEYRVPVFRLASSGISQLAGPGGELAQTKEFPGMGEVLAGTLRLAGAARRPLDRWLVWPAVVFSGGIAVSGFWLALTEGRRRRPKANG
jgi:apolipoprotein N-acyltransferase